MSYFQQLLTMATHQQEPVKMLMMFVKISEQSEGDKVSKGVLQPLMCVDKPLEQLDSYEALVKEADEIDSGWDFVFITSISANTEQSVIDDAMKSMVNDVQTGKNTQMYVVLDRKDNLVEMTGS